MQSLENIYTAAKNSARIMCYGILLFLRNLHYLFLLNFVFVLPIEIMRNNILPFKNYNISINMVINTFTEYFLGFIVVPYCVMLIGGKSDINKLKSLLVWGKENYFKYCIIYISYGIICISGLIILIVPYIVISIIYIFVPIMAILDERIKNDVFARSYTIARNNILDILVLYIIFQLATFLGAFLSAFIILKIIGIHEYHAALISHKYSILDMMCRHAVYQYFIICLTTLYTKSKKEFNEEKIWPILDNIDMKINHILRNILIHSGKLGSKLIAK